MEEKVFKDPVHNFIYVSEFVIWNLINTKEVQRLRRIRQLGTTYLTYHGAEHSRFSHSLGVYEVARRVLSSFARNEYISLSEEDQLVALSAALLHDVGHGPFSHSLESVVGKHHEDWTIRIIKDPETEVNQVLSNVDATLPDKVASVFQKTYHNKIITQLITSQVDADRMDYLVRDSLFTGVDYGRYDLDRLIRTLRPYEDKIVAKRSGLHTVEAYVLARYFMYWQVYFHPVVRSAEVLLKKIFERANLLAHEQTLAYLPKELKNLFLHTPSLNDYLRLDEAGIQYTFAQWTEEKDNVLSDLASRFLNRRLFKYTPYSGRDPRQFAQIEREFQKAGLDPVAYLEVDEATDVSYDYYLSAEGTSADHKPREEPIFLADESKLYELTRISKPVNAISRETFSEQRLYYPEDLLTPQLKKLLQLN